MEKNWRHSLLAYLHQRRRHRLFLRGCQPGLFCGQAERAALLSGKNLSDCALVTTGRLSGGMVAKAAPGGIPIVVSKAAPLSTGVALSKMVGMTLVAFVRNPNLYVYSGQERII